MKALPLVACAATLAACTPATTENDSFAANVSDVEDIPASEGNEAAPSAVVDTAGNLAGAAPPP